jgi:formamidopyrimidine-DNA glycosylase
MPELPDVEVYVEALRERVQGRTLESVRLKSPFLLRSADPPMSEATGRPVSAVSRLGKRIVFSLSDDLHLVLHLMIAGRLHWKEKGAVLTSKIALAGFDFSSGTLVLTEASSKKRASLHVVRGAEALATQHRGGLEVLSATETEFQKALQSESHTLKRALTDPRLFSGIGNAYSDEILHRARLSPMRLTGQLSRGEISQLFGATVEVLNEWLDRLRRQAGGEFPEKVTAFRAEMAVHGKYRKPCPVCGAPVQRIVYAENEANYCPRCQTAGKLLADRSLSRLLKEDWPRSLEELEALKRR